MTDLQTAEIHILSQQLVKPPNRSTIRPWFLCVPSLPVTEKVTPSTLKSIPLISLNPFIATICVKMWQNESAFLAPSSSALSPPVIRLYKLWDSALKLRRFPEAPCRSPRSGQANWQQAANTGSPGTAYTQAWEQDVSYQNHSATQTC